MTDGDRVSLIDLHIHPSLPWAGSFWRRRVQGFRPPSLEARSGPGLGLPGLSGPPRLYGAVFYETYLFRPRAARRRLFRSLGAFCERFGAQERSRILLSASDLHPAQRTDGGRDAFFLAVESMRCLRDPGDVQRLFACGVRSLQPIHFLDTPWGGSSREGLLPESRTGLTGSGREMLAEMARLGMILDLAHMSRRNAEESLAAYPGPVMCSHTGLREVKATARNLDADLAREIFRRRGLVGVTCWRHLLGPDPGPVPRPRPERGGRPEAPRGSRAAWTRSYAATVAAFGELAALAASAPEGHGPSPSHSLIAVGSDRGAPIRAPAWFYSPAHLAELEACLAGHGWAPEQVRGFFSGNAWAFLARSLPA